MTKKNIIITGASGLIATELTLTLLDKREYNIYLLSRNTTKIIERYSKYTNILCFTLDDFKNFNESQEIKYHCLINTSFARSSIGSDLVNALDYTYDLMNYAKSINLNCFVNISSQSVYGNINEPFYQENALLSPDYMYALGKYSTELLCKVFFYKTNVKFTNIRLSSVCENARFLQIFCKNAISGTPIVLTAPDQKVSFIDVRDVADALLLLIEKLNEVKLRPVYNLGTSENYTIRDCANLVKKKGKELYSFNVEVIEKSSENNDSIGMDCQLYRETFLWEPKKSLENMIETLYEFELNERHQGGGSIVPRSFYFVYKGKKE